MTFIVNMIPNASSGETNQDSEPNLAIDPADPRRIAGSAFTPDPLGGTNAPIFVSVDGGATWALNTIVPSTPGGATGDITLGFGHDRRLYGGILRRPGSLRLNILRTADMTAPTLMTVLVDRTGEGVDQPYVEAARVLRGPATGNDRVYVGNNDFNAASGRTATVDVSLDGAAAAPPSPANFVARRIEPRATNGQDMPSIRPAVHIDGTVYAAYFGRRAGGLSDVVVVRDDDWAAGATPFAALADSGDGLAGQRVVTGRTIPFENFQAMGMERLVASDLSIAIDPRDSSRLYVAWGDRPSGSTNLTLHVRRSTDRGQTWSADLRTVANAKAPVVAVNSRGRVGFLYQVLTGTGAAQRWVTRVERTGNDFTSFVTTVLATVAANAPTPAFLPYLGDYMDMKAVNQDFCGIFSTSNLPNNANFPNGVTYQRNANFATQTLLRNDGVTPVAVSIDPFFFRLTELAPDADFYVADWTDSAASFDLGVEPSVRPVFYATSDVWNRTTNAPGAFDASNRPVNQNPQSGPGPLGDNFAFARVRRRGTGSAQVVNTHFLVSEFGTGSNYQNAGATPDIPVSFAAGDSVITMAVGYPWHLGPTSSSHLCLAVEVSTVQDPVVSPSLLGRAPGWPTTDLLVINDNNKAQRNMGVTPTVVGGFAIRYVCIHNAATFRRDLVLRYEHVGSKPGTGDRLAVVGGRAETKRTEGRIVLADMLPGENRWVAVRLAGAGRRKTATVVFDEMVGNVPVNGFGIAVPVASSKDVIRHLLGRAVSVLSRLAEEGGGDEATAHAERAQAVLEGRADEAAFVRFVADVAPLQIGMAERLVAGQGGSDVLKLATAHRSLEKALDTRDLAGVLSHEGALLEGLDMLVTTAQKGRGDLADVCQTVRWQADLFRSPELIRIPNARRLIKLSDAFVGDFPIRRVDSGDYPVLVRAVLPVLRAAAEASGSDTLPERVEALAEALGDPQATQLRHREYLADLAGL